MSIKDELFEAANELIDHSAGVKTGARVHIPETIDVAAIRQEQGLSQTEFANLYGLNVASIRDYEQGRRVPAQSVRVLLQVIKKRPNAVIEALSVERRDVSSLV